MAYRLMNTGKHPLRVDLRGEPSLYLEPGAVSRPLREELLYHNPYLHEWERTGVVQRMPASMKEVLDDEAARAKPAPVSGLELGGAGTLEDPGEAAHGRAKRKRTPAHATVSARRETPSHGGRKTK